MNSDNVTQAILPPKKWDLLAYRQYQTPHGDRCASCDPSCLTTASSIVVEGLCSRLGSGGSRRVIVYNSDVCVQTFEDDQCLFATSINECDTRFPIDGCSNGYVWSRYDEWCVEAEAPLNEYTVPVIQQVGGPTLSSCQNGTEGVADLFGLADETLCFPGVVERMDSEFVAGSYRALCVGDTLETRFYSDATCTKQDDSQRFKETSRGSDCNIPTGSSIPSFVRVANCGGPSPIHCKSLVNTEVGVVFPPPDSSSTYITASGVLLSVLLFILK